MKYEDFVVVSRERFEMVKAHLPKIANGLKSKPLVPFIDNAYRQGWDDADETGEKCGLGNPNNYIKDGNKELK